MRFHKGGDQSALTPAYKLSVPPPSFTVSNRNIKVRKLSERPSYVIFDGIQKALEKNVTKVCLWLLEGIVALKFVRQNLILLANLFSLLSKDVYYIYCIIV